MRVAFLLATALLAAACGGPSAPPVEIDPAAQQLSTRGLDSMRFEPAELAARAGQPIQVTLDNVGGIVHDWTLTPPGGGRAVRAVAAGGQQARTPSFTLEAPGTYSFVCVQPGHSEAGMRGTLRVE